MFNIYKKSFDLRKSILLKLKKKVKKLTLKVNFKKVKLLKLKKLKQVIRRLLKANLKDIYTLVKIISLSQN